MRITLRISGAFLLVSSLISGSSAVHAMCDLPGYLFTSDYFTAPVTQELSSVRGVFWEAGKFHPASPAGTDNGTYPASEWIRATPGLGFYLAGDWASDPRIDGCIRTPPEPPTGKMNVVWTTSDGIDSYFVALCATADASGTFNGLAAIPGTAMTRLPRAVIRGSSRAGATIILRIALEPFAGGVYHADGCSLAVTSYRVYQRAVSRNAPSPLGRSPTDGWILAGQAPFGSDFFTEFACGGDSDRYLMATLVLDGNVEVPYGSRNSSNLQCGPTDANPSDEGDVPFIRRPKSGKGGR